MPHQGDGGIGVDAVPPAQLGRTRVTRGLAIGWILTGVAWVIAIAFSFGGWPIPVLLVALFASVSFGILVVLALWKRTRGVWTAIKSDDSPLVYLMLTTLGAVASSLFSVELWVLLVTGYFPWVPAFLNSVPVLVFTFPGVWVVVRLRDLRRLL